MRVYCSGPITGLPDLNRPAFDAAEKRLTAQGHFVINPHRISELFGTAEDVAIAFTDLRYAEDVARIESIASRRIVEAVMSADLAAVRSCDAIYLLRGWENSRGAKKELAEALKHGLEVMQEGGKE